MKICFHATETVKIAVAEQSVPIQHYLRQPQRLVSAIANPSLTDTLSEERFRVKMRPIEFMMYHFQPAVTLRVWADADGKVHLYSEECEIRGNSYINERFALNVQGKLVPYSEQGNTYLKGRADLAVEVDLPPALAFTPRPFLETTGNSLLKSVLQRIKTRLSSQLIQDYQDWASCHSVETPIAGFSPAENPIG